MHKVLAKPHPTDVGGHMGNVDDDESMVVRSFARETDTFTATARSNIFRINGELHAPTALAKQAAALTVDIVDVALSRIRILVFWLSTAAHSKERKATQEVATRVVIL
ncbi:MAG: hypothetical protein Q9193_003123 [Seirophora villosa]